MKADIKRVVSGNDIYKLVTIRTDNDETIFEAKLYCDSSKFKAPIDEKELFSMISKVPELVLNK